MLLHNFLFDFYLLVLDLILEARKKIGRSICFSNLKKIKAFLSLLGRPPLPLGPAAPHLPLSPARPAAAPRPSCPHSAPLPSPHCRQLWLTSGPCRWGPLARGSSSTPGRLGNGRAAAPKTAMRASLGSPHRINRPRHCPHAP